jgi:translation machinery-associated protein 16
MAPSTTVKSAVASKVKKEKVFHPASRKAGQLARHALRKGKLGNLSTKRNQKHNSLVDLYGFFFHAMPEEGVLTLEELHHIISDVWLTRFDEELQSEKATRRKGRPKSTRETALEEIKLREAEIYRTGIEVIDLTHPPTVELFRRWDQKEVAFIQLLRFIRISKTDPQHAVVSRPGKHCSVVEATTLESQDDGAMMEEVNSQAPASSTRGESLSRFSITIMAIDDL